MSLVKIGKILLLVSLLLISTPKGISAQEEQPEGPIYVVQEGDTLWDIAQRFGVSWEDLARENDISDPGQLTAGDELVIPGIAGEGEVLATTTVVLGENLRSLSRRYSLPPDTIIRLNHITSPVELYSGSSLIVPQGNEGAAVKQRVSVSVGHSLLESAVMNRVNAWSLVNENDLQGTWSAVPGDVLTFVSQDTVQGPGSLPGEISGVEITPDSLSQGKTTVVKLFSAEELSLTGRLAEHDLSFFQNGEGEYVAFQGIHALQEPGIYPLVISGETDHGVLFGFSQMVPVTEGDFAYASLQVPPETLDPENTEPEDELWNSLAEAVSPDKLWDGVFQRPVAPSECGYTDTFGNRRSYNGSPYNYFHTGLDFCYNYNLEVNEIYAPADGVVVFAGPLVVRGNAVMIDHGWGVYSAYMHQAEIKVEEGDQVQAGQVIGIVGQTGRVNGPHLHLEIWAGGVQVDPLDWLENVYP
jgi:murein DD-endopeptidase MepM/ murein hydrolase activator NlpD